LKSGAEAAAGARAMDALPPQLLAQPPLAANLNSPLAEARVWVVTHVLLATKAIEGVVFHPLWVPGIAMEV